MWINKSYVDEFAGKERMEITWQKADIWKLRGIRRELERKYFPQCLGEEEAKHIPLKCSETKKWREEFACSKWLIVKEVIEYRK